MTEPSAAPRIDFYGLTHIGKVRSMNEDQFLVAALQKSMRLMQTSLEDVRPLDNLRQSAAYLMVVADGVGGVGGGRLASGTAVEVLAQYVGQAMGCYYEFDVELEHEFLDQLDRAVHQAHQRVQQEYSAKGKGPATTLTMVTVIWPRAYIIHIGDSRAYYHRRGHLRQLTSDQTMGDMLVDEGLMSEEQAKQAGLHNVLASAIGAEITPSVGLLDLDAGDTLLLCTDGLTKHVSDEVIASTLSTSQTAEEASRHLVERALEGGGSDNITVVVAKIPDGKAGSAGTSSTS